MKRIENTKKVYICIKVWPSIPSHFISIVPHTKAYGYEPYAQEFEKILIGLLRGMKRKENTKKVSISIKLWTIIPYVPQTVAYGLKSYK